MFNNLIGPGRKSNLRPIRVTRYMPHQGDQEKARRLARLLPAVDSAGQPWNPDLHVAARSLNKDGTWRKKGGRR